MGDDPDADWYCTKCGGASTASALFCSQCGDRFDVEPATARDLEAEEEARAYFDELEEDLAKASNGWTSPLVVRIYAGGVGGEEEQRDEATIFEVHGYARSVVQNEPARTASYQKITRGAGRRPSSRRSGGLTPRTPPPTGNAGHKKRNAAIGGLGLVVVLLVIGSLYGPSKGGGGSGSGGNGTRTEADFGPSIAEIKQRNPDVYNVRFEDDFLMIQIGGDWTDLGATRFACEDVKPVLTAHGLGDQDFAIYDRFGKVISTGGRCP